MAANAANFWAARGVLVVAILWRADVMIIAGLAILLVGLGLWLFAGRGRRVDDHRRCRRCHYDLTGLPKTFGRCPECGAELLGKNAVYVGTRMSRRRVKAAGMVIAVMAMGVLIVGVNRWWQTFDGMAWTPFFMLRSEFHNASAKTSGTALAEIERRLERGTISQAQARALMEDVLAWEWEGAARWNPEWSGLLYRNMNKWEALGVTKGDFEALLAGSLQFTLRVRPRVESGTALPFELRMRCLQAARLENPAGCYDCGCGWQVSGHLANVRARVIAGGNAFDAEPLDDGLHESVPMDYETGGELVMRFSAETSKMWQALKNGPQQGTFEMEFDVGTDYGGAPMWTHQTRSLPFASTILPAGEPTVTPVFKPELRELMEDAVSAQLGFCGAGSYVTCKTLPENLAYSGVLKNANAILAVGELAWAKGRKDALLLGPLVGDHGDPGIPTLGPLDFQMGGAWGVGPASNGAPVPEYAQPEAGPVELILTPNRRAAERTIDLDTYWNEPMRVIVRIDNNIRL